jgi:hypothetical protein
MEDQMAIVRSSIGILMTLLATASVSSAQTKIIDNGADGAKKVIVVMGDGYAAGADQTKFNGDVDTLLTNGVFGHDFWQENQNAFNVYRLNLESAESGVSQRRYDEKGTPTDGSDDTIISTTIKNTSLGYIYSGSWAHCWLEGGQNTGALVNQALAQVPKYDFVVVILNEDGFGGCGGGGFQVVPRGVSWPVLAHEYGHGVGGLADEYVVDPAATYTGGDWNGPNCSNLADRDNVFWNRYIDPATPVPTPIEAAADTNRTVGLFEGCSYVGHGIYRPVYNCRMNSNFPDFCPVCRTYVKKALYPFLEHDFTHALTGDFDGDGKSDVLIHNGADLEIDRSNGSLGLTFSWIANNIVPAAPGGTTWKPAANDQYLITDFNGDGKDDVVVFNAVDWDMPYLGLLRSTGAGLECIARYDGSIPGFWSFTSGDTFLAGDFDGDGKKDLFIFNGANWSTTYLGLLHSTGTELSGYARHDGSVPGWTLSSGDHAFVGDFDGDGMADLYMSNTTNWGSPFLGMFRSDGWGLSAVKVFQDYLPGWSMSSGDQFYVGDFNGDRKDDLYVFNGTNWGIAYLMMAASTGTDLTWTNEYNGSSDEASVPGWGQITSGDTFYLADVNKDGKADLFVFNATNWSTEYLGALVSDGTALSGGFIGDWVGGWNLGVVDQFLVANYEGGAGKADLFVRNKEWFGLLRDDPYWGFVMDRIHFHWIQSPLYDSKPWSDSMP